MHLCMHLHVGPRTGLFVPQCGVNKVSDFLVIKKKNPVKSTIHSYFQQLVKSEPVVSIQPITDFKETSGGPTSPPLMIFLGFL